MADKKRAAEKEAVVVPKVRRRKHAVGEPACGSLAKIPDSVMWMILQFLPLFNTLPEVLRTVAPLRRFALRNLTTDGYLHRWFAGAIPFFVESGPDGKKKACVVPLIFVGGLWAALARVCRMCDVCHKRVTGGFIDPGLWIMAHAKCFSDNTCAEVPAYLKPQLKLADAPVSGRGLYVRGSTWMPPGVFPHAWTVFGVAALDSAFCGLKPLAKSAEFVKAFDCAKERKEAEQRAVEEAGEAMSKLAQEKEARLEAHRKDLAARREAAQKLRLEQLGTVLGAYVRDSGWMSSKMVLERVIKELGHMTDSLAAGKAWDALKSWSSLVLVPKPLELGEVLCLIDEAIRDVKQQVVVSAVTTALKRRGLNVQEGLAIVKASPLFDEVVSGRGFIGEHHDVNVGVLTELLCVYHE